MEPEIIDLAKTDEKAEWLRSFFKYIHHGPKILTPLCIHCDSQDATSMASIMIYNKKSLHI